jgi:hypothetical protein
VRGYPSNIRREVLDLPERVAASPTSRTIWIGEQSVYTWRLPGRIDCDLVPALSKLEKG